MTPSQALRRAVLLGHAAVPRFPAPPALATTPAAVLRRTLVTQVSPREAAEVGGAPTIEEVHIVGRPEKLFSSSMGDHTTAFAVHREALRGRLRGKTAAEGMAVVGEALNHAVGLPGYALRANLPEAHAARLATSEAALRDLLGGPAPGPGPEPEAGPPAPGPPGEPATFDRLQKAVNAFLEFRELVPLSAVNVREKNPSLAGKGKGEAGHVTHLALHQRGAALSAEARFTAILGAFDLESSALAATELDPELLGKMLPGMLPTVPPAERAALMVLQHLASVAASFPAVFDEELSRENAGGRLLEHLRDSMARRIAIAREYLVGDQRANREKRAQAEANLAEAQSRRNSKRDQRIATDWLHRLDESDLRIEAQLDALGASLGDLERAPVALPPEAMEAEGAVVQDEDDWLDEEERNSPLATQVSMAGDGTIDQILSAGRSPSPLSGTMGAHTTAWVVHVDVVREAMEGKTLAEAFAALHDTLIPHAVGLMDDRLASGLFVNEQPERLTQAKDRLEGLPRLDGVENPSALQSQINQYLTFVNYIPGATVDRADTGGKAEGAARNTLLAFERGGAAPKSALSLAMYGLLDRPWELGMDAIDRLVVDHQATIRLAYPKSAAAVFDGDLAPEAVRARILPEPAPNPKKRSFQDRDESSEWEPSSED